MNNNQGEQPLPSPLSRGHDLFRRPSGEEKKIPRLAGPAEKTSSPPATTPPPTEDRGEENKNQSLLAFLPPQIRENPLYLALLAGMGALLILFFVLSLVKNRRGNPPLPPPLPTPTTVPVTPLSPSPTPAPTPATVIIDQESIFFLREGNLWKIQADSTNEKQVTQADVTLQGGQTVETMFNVPALITDFAWHPSTQQLAVISGRDLWLLRTKDQSRTAITPTDLGKNIFYRFPHWAPNGKMIALEYRQEIVGNALPLYKIQVFSTAGKLLHEISLERDFPLNNSSSLLRLADWFPNNQELLIYQEGDSDWQGLWRISLDKVRRERLVAASLSTAPIKPLPVDLSPDGKRLVYIENNRAWLFDLVQGNKRSIDLLPPDLVIFQPPQFSPDGQKILFIFEKKDSHQVYLAFYDWQKGSKDLFWSGLVGRVRNFSWSPQGERVVFSLSAPLTDTNITLWVLDVVWHGQSQITTNALFPQWATP